MQIIRLAALKAVAVAAARNTYSPYSEFAVGAACLLSDGAIFPGTNIENASFGLTICAERACLFNAFSNHSMASIEIIAIYTPTPEPSTPCGACRQVILELAPLAIVVCFCNGPNELTFKSQDLLPSPFSLSHEGTRCSSLNSPPRKPNEFKERMCIDIDNVIAQSDALMREVIQTVTHGRVNLNYDNVRRFNYWECQDDQGQGITRDEWKEVHDAFSQPLILEKIKPVEGSVETLQKLSERFALHFATARLPLAREATIRWLAHWDFPFHDLHFLRHGEKHASLGRFQVSVEDDGEQALAFAHTGTPMSIVIAHPWNAYLQGHPLVTRLSNWHEVELTLNKVFYAHVTS
jgi:cytidine deaminase